MRWYHRDWLVVLASTLATIWFLSSGFMALRDGVPFIPYLFLALAAGMAVIGVIHLWRLVP